MIATILMILTLIYGALTLTTGFAGSRLWDADKALPTCAVLVLLFLVNTQVQYNWLLVKILLSAGAAAGVAVIFNFFTASNHFIISLDIIALLSMLLLILQHKFKMVKTSPAR